MPYRYSGSKLRRCVALAAALLFVPVGINFSQAQLATADAGHAEAAASADEFLHSQFATQSTEITSASDLVRRLRERSQQPQSESPSPPAATGGTFTIAIDVDKPKPPPAAPPPSQAVANAEFQIAAAESSFHQAQDLQRQAQQTDASNPQYAIHLRKQAVQKLAESNGWMQKAMNGLAGGGLAPGRSATATGSLSLSGACDHPACRQLQEIAGRDIRGLGTGGPRLQLFDNNRRPESGAPAPVPDRIMQGSFVRSHNPDDRIRIAPNVEVSIAPLRRAVALVAPAVAQRPLFSAGPGAVPAPSLELTRLIASPQMREQLRRVGGVALDVTVDLLGAAGVAELRGGLDLTFLETPVIISLAKLVAAVGPYASEERWAALPEAMRFPGGVERIYGYILDPETEDIFLVGRTAEQLSRRLDIDMLVIALRQSWRDGKVMGVSLDPLPTALDGPQYSRFINVPADSIAARTMLDADYAMKWILNRGGFPNSPKFIDVAKAYLQAADESGVNRFWLAPRPLGAAALHVSRSGRTTLFETGVDSLTEDMLISNERLIQTGQRSGLGRHLAATFNEKYGEIEQSQHVAPHGVFARLHGLVDVVTLARLWRARGIAYPVLGALARLPHRRLSGNEAAPSYYPSLPTEIHAGGKTWYVTGGVEVRPRESVNSTRTFADGATAALEREIEKMRMEKRFAARAAIAIVLASGQPASLAAARAMDLRPGYEALLRQDLNRAVAIFSAALQTDPLELAAYLGLGQAHIAAGRLREAAGVVANAILLAPNDQAVRLMSLDVLWRNDRKRLFAAADTQERRDLSRYYERLARLAISKGQRDEVARYTDWAIEIWEDNGHAHFMRGGLLVHVDEQRRMAHLVRAIRGFRRQVAEGQPEAAKPLALMLALSAYNRIGRTLSAAAGTPVDFEDLGRARSDSAEAIRLDPALPIGPTVSATASAALKLVSASAGARLDLSAELSQADSVVARFPDHPMVYSGRAGIRQMAGNVSGAVEDMTQALKVAPALRELYMQRALLYVALRRCVEARADLEEARQIASDADKRSVNECK